MREVRVEFNVVDDRNAKYASFATYEEAENYIKTRLAQPAPPADLTTLDFYNPEGYEWFSIAKVYTNKPL